MVLNTLDNGSKTNSMGMEFKIEQMVQSIKGNLFKVKSKERENFIGKTNQHIKDNLRIIIYKE